MIKYTDRLDLALRKASIAHDANKQFRKGANIPYIIHPFGVMLIASKATDEEDILIACLLHDVLEDVPSTIYGEDDIESDFGQNVLRIVKDVTKNPNIKDWKEVNLAYLEHLEVKASTSSLIVCAADKIQNMISTIIDFKTHGPAIWKIFTTNSKDDQIWYYSEVLQILKDRNCPKVLLDEYEIKLKEMINLKK